MSLLLILRKIWKYKLVTFPILGCIVAGSLYVIAVTAPTYEAASTYILVNPPPPPTEDQIARDPSLKELDTDNPYLGFDGSVLVQVLASRLTSDEVRANLATQGADPNYVAAPSAEFGFSAPILQITGTGTSPAGAVNTANVVGLALTQELDQMQKIRGVSKTYRIKAEAVVGAHDAKLKASGKLRSLVGVFVLGVILLFIAISVLDALRALRAEWAQRRIADDYVAVRRSVDEPPMTRDSLSFSDADPDAEQWPLEARR
jgi:capsular polysaccharide biosynthesis protein